MDRIQTGHQYKGVTYTPWIDSDSEGFKCKIFHDVVCPDGKTSTMDWSPYSSPSPEMFALWVDLGMPNRITRNGFSAPLTEKDLLSLRNGTNKLTN